MVFDFQGSLTGEMVDHGFLTPNSLPFACVRRVEAWIVDHADAIVTSTRHGADVLMRDFGCPASRITVVPDAVNPDRFQESPTGPQERNAELRNYLGIPDGRPVVVYLGLLAEYQGITHLLHAAEKMLRDGEDLHFLVMGFPGEERYRTLAQRLGIEERVTLTGAIRYEEARDYLALGALAVSPKLSSTEGNGKLLNYMAMGLPTVTFDTPVNREILGNLGIYAPFGDWSAMATEIAQALRDTTGSADRGRALRQRVLEVHTWKAAVEPLLAVYARLLR
jgi:glycosyltransferase involved in cell wall biosynthesis